MLTTNKQVIDSTHKESTPMKVAFLTNDKAQADALKKALNEPESEEGQDMLAFVAVRNVVSQLVPCGVRVPTCQYPLAPPPPLPASCPRHPID